MHNTWCSFRDCLSHSCAIIIHLTGKSNWQRGRSEVRSYCCQSLHIQTRAVNSNMAPILASQIVDFYFPFLLVCSFTSTCISDVLEWERWGCTWDVQFQPARGGKRVVFAAPRYEMNYESTLFTTFNRTCSFQKGTAICSCLLNSHQFDQLLSFSNCTCTHMLK